MAHVLPIERLIIPVSVSGTNRVGAVTMRDVSMVAKRLQLGSAIDGPSPATASSGSLRRAFEGLGFLVVFASIAARVSGF